MPDPTRQSVSASQAAALLNLSPYATRWLLWQHFRDPKAVPLDTRPDQRMAWGKKLQSVILAATAEEYRLDVEENTGELYVRRGVLGCTRDAMMADPATGPVVVQAKNVALDQWRRNWTETTAPAYVELQVQTEMYAMEARRGIISVLIGGNELRFYERKPDPAITDRLVEEATLFFLSLVEKDEPDVAGEAIELPALQALYAARPELKELDAQDDAELGDQLRQYKWAQEQRLFCEKQEKTLKARVLGRARDASLVRGKGARARIATHERQAHLCKNCGAVVRAGSLSATISVALDVQRPNFLDDFAVG